MALVLPKPCQDAYRVVAPEMLEHLKKFREVILSREEFHNCK